MKKNIYNPANLQRMIEKEEKSLFNSIGNIIVLGIASLYMLTLQHADFFGKIYFMFFGK